MRKPKYKVGDVLELVYTSDRVIVTDIVPDLKGYDDYVIIDDDGFIVRIADIKKKVKV